MILKDPTLTGHIHESNLNNLLSPHMNSQLEKTYVDYEIVSTDNMAMLLSYSSNIGGVLVTPGSMQ